ncbi:hypothetical protein T4A_6684 [Trichinella pseudospiralis]|uniref:Uncharacterized protein n=1 Tax=Trichinella pseudospiralis TaxID=6337 RepID=A0A0V1E6P4_TRIPS|nr:hypothetical protein T4A_6684 [Trichinella pseudospiralis]
MTIEELPHKECTQLWMDKLFSTLIVRTATFHTRPLKRELLFFVNFFKLQICFSNEEEEEEEEENCPDNKHTGEMVLNFTACGKVNMMCLKEIAPYTTARIVRGLIEEEIRFTDFKSKEQELFFKSDIKEDNRQLTAPSIVNKRVWHSGEVGLCACWLASIIHIFTSAPDPALSLLTLAALHHVNQAAPSSLDKPLQSFWKSSLVRVGVVTTAGANQSRPTVFNGFTSTVIDFESTGRNTALTWIIRLLQERSEFNCRPRWAN